MPEVREACIKVMTPRGLVGGYIKGSGSFPVIDGDEITIDGFFTFNSETLQYSKDLQLFRFNAKKMSLTPVEAN